MCLRMRKHLVQAPYTKTSAGNRFTKHQGLSRVPPCLTDLPARIRICLFASTAPGSRYIDLLTPISTFFLLGLWLDMHRFITAAQIPRMRKDVACRSKYIASFSARAARLSQKDESFSWAYMMYCL